jgi:hypothetical protein
MIEVIIDLPSKQTFTIHWSHIKQCFLKPVVGLELECSMGKKYVDLLEDAIISDILKNF